MRNFERTNYPSIFENTYWGRGTQKYSNNIYHNRNTFVQQYQIKSYVRNLPAKKKSLIDDIFKKQKFVNRHIYDKVENYLTTSNKYICVVSPYITDSDDDFKSLLRSLDKNNFKLFEPIYSNGASTFIFEVSDGFMTYKEDKIQGLRQFIENPNIYPNVVDEHSESPLHHAIETNQVDIVEKLLNNPKIKVNLKDQYNETPLHRAIDNYQTDIVVMLLKHERINLNINSGNTWIEENWITPLELCYEKNIMDFFKMFLQDCRINPNLDGDKNLLHIAIKDNAHVAVELLLQHPQIELNEKDGQGNTELHQCIEYGNNVALDLLLNHPSVDVNLKNNNGDTILYQCIEYGNDRMDQLRILLKHPAVNLNIKHSFKNPLLHLIVADGEFEDVYLDDENRIELFKIMVENLNLDVNIRNDYDKTVLERSCLSNSVEWVYLILKYSSLEDVQRVYYELVDNVSDNVSDGDHDDNSDDDMDDSYNDHPTNEILDILNNYIENYKKEDRYLTEKFCMCMIQPSIHTKKSNPLYLGPDLFKVISSYLQWSDISTKKTSWFM